MWYGGFKKAGAEMAKVYSRVTKINNVAGRRDYISNPDRQEFIKLTGKSRAFDWKDYADFEKMNQKSHAKNNEARELVIALPNEMSERLSDKILDDFSHDLAQELLGKKRDYEFALHFNQSQTNLHMHLLFSERERNTERQPKVYKRDMWFDKTTNRMTKAQAKNAECRYKKGDVMKDKHGHIKYDDDPFTKKDKAFTERSWLKAHQETIQNVLAEYHYVLDIFDDTLEIAQKKLYKGASADYLEYAAHWNQMAYEANTTLKEARSALLSEYKVLKPLMNEYTVFSGKEQEMDQADLHLKIFKQNGYAGDTWNVFQRTKYFLKHYEEDQTNVQSYKELSNKIFRSVFNQADFQNPTHYFKLLLQKIKTFPEIVRNVKQEFIKQYGTIERYKNYQHALAKKEREKEQKPKSPLDLRLERLKAEHKQQGKQKKREPSERNKGLSR